ncbi:MAG: protein kinase, partial [Candidatus Hydrogenedentes bacterium]|nr:protein kinase [Candidatus Hydrogenedentota bacterium]
MRKVGCGGMGAVFEAEDEVLQRRVAVKVLTRASDETELLVEKFRIEAMAAANLDHPNIVQVFRIGQDKGYHYFSMQYVDGATIREEIRKRGRIDVDSAMSIVRQAADALGFAHRAGIIHRDIKSTNLMIDSTGRLRITDFGIAKFARIEDDSGEEEFFLGTPEYSAPEQLLGEEVDGRADIFSLGVVLYEMLAGVLPFRGSSHRAVAERVLKSEPLPLTSFDPRMPNEVQGLVSTMLAKDVRARFQSCEPLIEAIDKVRLELAQGSEAAQRRRLSAKRSGEPEGKVEKAATPLSLGNEHFERGEFGQAAQYYRKAIEAKTDFGEARERLGQCYVAQRCYAEAKSVWEEALRADPGNMQLWTSLENLDRLIAKVEGAPEGVAERHMARLGGPEEEAGSRGGFQVVMDEPPASVTRNRLASEVKSRRTIRPAVPIVALAILAISGALFVWTARVKSATEQVLTEEARRIIRNGYVPFDLGASVLIPAARVNLGNNGQVEIGAFRIDKYEVTNGQYERDVLDRAASRPAHWPGRECPEELRDLPVVNVSYDDAEAYALRRGKRLPTESEWKLAAGCFGGNKWPWGELFDPAKCNTKERGAGCAVPVGLSIFGNDRSRYGVHDMAGNVSEWT